MTAPHVQLPDGPSVPATIIPGYQLHTHLGSGMFGSAFTAIELKFPRTVVIKIPRRGDEARTATLVAELRMTAQLSHPNIVAVFNTGTFELDGATWPFYAMEYLQGQPLAAGFVDQRKRYSLGQNAQLFLSLVNAVLHAHTAGVFHCDLHPRNIVLLPGDPLPAVKLIDFGFPSLVGARRSEPRQLDLASLKQLWTRYFAFPDANGKAAALAVGATTVLALRDAVQRLLDRRFYDADVHDVGGIVIGDESTAERADRLADVALLFAKEHALPRPLSIAIKAHQPADLAWEAKGDLCEIVGGSGISHDACGSFLLLMALAQQHLAHTGRTASKLVALGGLAEDVVDNFVAALDFASAALQLELSGFFHERVKLGMTQFVERTLDKEGGPMGQLVALHALTMRHQRKGVLPPIAELDERQRPLATSLWGFAFLLSRLRELPAPFELAELLQAWIETFAGGERLFAHCSPGGRVEVAPVARLKPPWPIVIDDQGLAIGDDLRIDHAAALDLYACLLTDLHYRQPLSQRFATDRVAVRARRGIGLLVAVDAKVYCAEKQDGPSLWTQLLAELDRYTQPRRELHESVMMRVESILEWHRARLYRDTVIGIGDYRDRDFKDDYFEVIARYGVIVHRERRADGIEALSKRIDDELEAIAKQVRRG